MSLRPRKRLLALGCAATLAVAALVGATGYAAPAQQQGQSGSSQQQAAPIDWSAVEQALGKPGELQPGDVFRVSLPRTDLDVSVGSVKLKPAFALGSYAAFKQVGSDALVMGDLVLLDEEVNPVLSGLFQGGFDVDALHNHLNGLSRHVMYVHYAGRGDAVQMATALREALSVTRTPFGSAPAGGPAGGPEIDTQRIEQLLGHEGKMLDGGVFQVSVPRAEGITMDGVEIPPAMGVAMPFSFQPTGDGKAAITGDFVLTASEVNAVARTLREHDIEVTALHNHGLTEEPRLFYMHFWAHDDATRLAEGLRAALDQTNHQ
ncbi:MAG: DUF1259 domain-containing protein [Chloroflexi bacterium]|nr:DUF1259 domain-containing protein [Chloroflexota bacterium]